MRFLTCALGTTTRYAPEGDKLGNSWRIAGDGTNWGALSQCMNKNAPLQQYARPGAWCVGSRGTDDPDARFSDFFLYHQERS